MKIYKDKFENVEEALNSLKELLKKEKEQQNELMIKQKELKLKAEIEEKNFKLIKDTCEATKKDFSNKCSELSKLQKDMLDMKNNKKEKAILIIENDRSIKRNNDSINLNQKENEKLKKKIKFQKQCNLKLIKENEQIENDSKTLKKQILNVKREQAIVNDQIEAYSTSMRKQISYDDKCENFQINQENELGIRQKHIRGIV